MLERTAALFTGQTTAWPLTWGRFREGELKSENRCQEEAWRSRAALEERHDIAVEIDAIAIMFVPKCAFFQVSTGDTQYRFGIRVQDALL